MRKPDLSTHQKNDRLIAAGRMGGRGLLVCSRIFKVDVLLCGAGAL